MVRAHRYATRGKPLIGARISPGQTHCATMLSADLHGLDVLLEVLKPVQVATLLRELLDLLSGAVLELGGLLVGLEDAGVLAAFGLGDTRRAHLADALAAARAIQVRFSPVRADWWLRHSIETAVGIGIHRGEVAVLALAPLHPAALIFVGEAARGAAALARRARAGEILVTGAAHEPERDGPAALTPLPPLTLRGRSAPLEVWCQAVIPRLPMRAVFKDQRADASTTPARAAPSSAAS